MDEARVLRLYGAVPDSIVDGPGLRYAIFVQGCTHACPGCHNPDSQPHESGEPATLGALLADIRANGLVHDVTFSGGEPFEQSSACAELARELKRLGYGIWAYSGYLYEDLERIAAQAADVPGRAADAPVRAERIATQAADAPEPSAAPAPEAASALDPRGVRDLLDCVDVLVDGPFVESLKSLGLKWRGSSNQRLVDVPATRRAGRIVTWQSNSFVPRKPASW